MTYPPRITDETVLARWMGLETARMNAGVVRDRKPLSLLLAEKDPSATAKNGERHSFDRAVIRMLGENLPEELHRQLKLPILFYCSLDVPDSCSCPDKPALATLRMLGDVGSLRTMQGSRFWISRSLVYGIMGKYPTAVQIVVGV